MNVRHSGYTLPYREGRDNPCPGCGRDQWWVGLATAECAFCATALELDRPTRPTKPKIIRRGKTQ